MKIPQTIISVIILIIIIFMINKHLYENKQTRLNNQLCDGNKFVQGEPPSGYCEENNTLKKIYYKTECGYWNCNYTKYGNVKILNMREKG